MDEDILFNAILFHELGHHIAHESEFASSFRSRLRSPLHERFLTIDEYVKLDNRQRQNVTAAHLALLVRWSEELFCDCFGVMIAGPQMSFALRDLSPAGYEQAFSSTHPAPGFRLHTQWELLSELGWIKSFPADDKSFPARASRTFADLQRPAQTTWFWQKRTPLGKFLELTIGLLEKSLEDIKNEAAKFVSDRLERPEDFWQDCSPVNDALCAQIVPSTIVVKKTVEHSSESYGESDTAIIHPSPTTLINVGRAISEDGCRRLVEEWPETDADRVTYDDQQHIERRLFAWVGKAIGDWLLPAIGGGTRQRPDSVVSQ